MKRTRHLYAWITLLSVIIAVSQAGAQGRGFRGGRGPDESFVADRDLFHFLLEHHRSIERRVTPLPNGVETVTESADPEVAEKIQQHVAGMYRRLEQRQPIRMRDPLFAELFRHSDRIHMTVEKTQRGTRVRETSDEAYVVSLIQAHAKVVSNFVALGFAEAHKMHAIPGDPTASGARVPADDSACVVVFREFDRVYIPALALSNQKKLEPTRQALQRLSTSWDERFVQSFANMFEGDPAWPLDIRQIAQLIALAEALLVAEDMQRAHETLEPIRDLLTEARVRNNVVYPLDALSRFHATMEAIVKPAMQLTPDALSEEQIQRYRQLAEQATREWNLVAKTEFDLAWFGKSEEQQRDFPRMIRSEREAIAALVSALESKDKAAIVQTARGLKPPFARVYMYFGDFGPDGSDKPGGTADTDRAAG